MPQMKIIVDFDGHDRGLAKHIIENHDDDENATAQSYVYKILTRDFEAVLEALRAPKKVQVSHALYRGQADASTAN